jgi:DNA polymerase I
MALESFREIWAVDFEFVILDGERPKPICLVARELRTGRSIRLWHDQFGPRPPYALDAGSLFVAYYASAELGCHKVLGWPMPERILDLFTEFRDRTNGLHPPFGSGLLGALAYFGLDSIGTMEKTEMRDLILRGGPWSADERVAILDYCESDVDALARLLPVMLQRLDVPHALLRGRYMAAAATMEHHGIPIDVPLLEQVSRQRVQIRERLIAEVDQNFQVYEGCTFKTGAFREFLIRARIPWPHLATGAFDLSEDAFKLMAVYYPALKPLADLRKMLADLRSVDLKVGKDGRGRTILSAFQARTGRNQPSNSKFIFGPSAWFRGFIRPSEGRGLAYIDWEQQEFAIAAALSGDAAMQEAYRSSDPYLAFGKQAGIIPADATKESHGPQRKILKECVLGVQYGMGSRSLAAKIEQPEAMARELLDAHHRTYTRFWSWSDAVVNEAMLKGELQTALGWHQRIGPNSDPHFLKGNGREIMAVNPRALRNFPMQANGAEMLRLACCLGTERGIEVCAPVHDAVLIGAPLDRLDEDVGRMQAAMAEASRIVLDGFEVKTEARIIRYPDRYIDKDQKGFDMWERVLRILDEIELKKGFNYG